MGKPIAKTSYEQMQPVGFKQPKSSRPDTGEEIRQDIIVSVQQMREGKVYDAQQRLEELKAELQNNASRSSIH